MTSLAGDLTGGTNGSAGMSASLRGRLLRLRRRLLTLGALAASAWGVATAALLLLLFVWIDLLVELSPPLRLGLSGAALAGGMVLLFGAYRATRRRAGPQSLARRLDDLRQTGGQILSGVDLMLQPAPAAALTAGMAQMAVARAGTLAESVTPKRAVPARPVARAGGALLLLAGAVGVLAVLLPRVATTQWLRFADPYGDHPPYSPLSFSVEPGQVNVVYGDGLDVRATATGAPVDRIELVLQPSGDAQPQTLPMFPEPSGQWRATIASVTQAGQYYVRVRSARSQRFDLGVITVPQLRGVRFRITPPAYTHDPPYEGPVPQAGLAGLPGTRVEFWASSNRSLSGGTMEIAGEQGATIAELTPVAVGAAEVTGSFEIHSAGTLSLAVIDAAGQPSKERFTSSIVVLADQRPFVRVLQPQPVSLATPDVELPVSVSAEDDFGVSRFQLYRSLNDSRPLPADLGVQPPESRRVRLALALPLARYGLKPGDVIKLFARVEDNDPTGRKGAESPIVQVQIISQEDFERMIRRQQGLEVLQSKYDAARRRLESLDKRIRDLQEKLAKQPGDSGLSEAQRKELDALAEQMRKDAEEIRKSAEHKLPYDLDQTLTEQLDELARKLAEAGNDTEQLARQPKLGSGAAGEELEKLRQRLGEQSKDFDEQAMKPLRHLAAVLPLMLDAERFVQLYQRQRDLAERLAALKGRDGEDDPSLKARMRDLEEEQNQLRGELGRLLDDIEKHADLLPVNTEVTQRGEPAAPGPARSLSAGRERSGSPTAETRNWRGELCGTREPSAKCAALAMEDPDLAALRDSALEFVAAVRESGADQAMADAAAGLAEFSGTRGYENAKRAADVLEKFISKCQGMSGKAGQCLKFAPSLGQCLGNTAAQLLADYGFGMGAGSGGGYSAQSSNLQNVGLYGALPNMAPAGQRGEADSGAPALSAAPDQAAADATQSVEAGAGGQSRASGVDTSLIPARYRRRVTEYFQRIADELGQ